MKEMMTKKDVKFYVCIHNNCSFNTEKRKAIYTHLLRTHCERKEDYECEYCSLVFHDETQIERHLSEHHASQPFTYTCVSRIEHVISKCARLGGERRKSLTQGQAVETDKQAEKTVENFNSVENWLKSETQIKTENEPQDESLEDETESKTDILVGSNSRTKASVNASLNSIAKTSMLSVDNIKQEISDGGEQLNYESQEREPDIISPPHTGLKIKLNLKQIAECISAREMSASPPLLERHVTSPEVALDSQDSISTTPPNIIQNQSNHGVSIREKASKYYDRLEVYHTTDERGMRCCPFCTYKTSKNTIRVHLSGIHKIHFVKCSLCEYKAAFPHQITQHGVKFHKTTNLNVIQLSKESRDKTIAKLSKNTDFLKSNHIATKQGDIQTQPEPIIEYDRSNCSYIDEAMSSGSCSPSEEEEEEHQGTSPFKDIKVPKTMKTTYFSLQYENGACVYSCNLCSFKTSVRATIYTHKYRHEQKSYRCGHCDFTSFPRSNVAHHCRSKHKDLAVKIEEISELARDESEDMKQSGSEQYNDNIIIQPLGVKQEPIDDSYNARNSSMSAHVPDNWNSVDTLPETAQYSNNQINTPQTMKTSPTIIKVPEFKRSFMTVPFNETKNLENSKKRKTPNQAQGGYKLSLNKLYRFNPVGSPKYMCARCPYACDTHPKMKHHLYRHRPQRYKCPYCEHRKYPRSYVVRHVRDTHRGKPLRVLDLLKDELSTDDAEGVTEGVADFDEGDYQDTEFETSENNEFENSNVSTETGNAEMKTGVTVKTEPLDSDTANLNSHRSPANIQSPASYKVLADRLQLNLNRDFSDKMFSQTPDVSPNFSETVFTSTPLIESIINNGQFPATPKPTSRMYERKKSLKDYRMNTDGGPRYMCNKCSYGTDNYKTIHNHMYRHESQRYQCPYCGYRRSPRSFVENHIREVHKGNPVIVTELTENLGMDVPIGSPRQCVNLKRKEPTSEVRPQSSSPLKKVKLKGNNSLNATPKLPVKWPAPKPVANVNLTPPKLSPKLQKPNLKHETRVQENTHAGVQLSRTNGSGEERLSSPKNCGTGFNMENSKTSQGATGMSNSSQSQPFHFKEGSRTTFKTMYKCVFDPETCNHISKDKSKMKQHLFMHVEYKPWTCDFCDMTASQSSHIKNHVRTEHPGVSVKSFKFKKHNYLEKHIEGFLSKSLFTVPVSEYRRIMDMKGNTKKIPRPYRRDDDGFIICPYCDYKTKSGVMTDHVKMKHMQARFKCHWCDYSAFYRSEIRKHHRKERSHMDREFKTQELDLSQVLSGKDGIYRSRYKDSVSMSVENGEDHQEDLIDDDSDTSSSGYSDCDDSDNNMSSNCSSVGDGSDSGNREMSPPQSNCAKNTASLEPVHPCKNSEYDSNIVATEPDISVKTENIVDNHKVLETETRNASITQNKFQCGYCPFSASLRVKVKMHCSKKHPDSEVRVIDPNAVKGAEKTKSKDDIAHLGVVENITRVDANDWKGTKFEQDLKRAGVSKLNLASLFPKTKKIKLECDKPPNDDDNHRMEDNTKLPVVNCRADMVTIKAEKTVENLQAIPLNNVHSSKKLNSQPVRPVQNSSEPEFKVPKPPSPILKLTDKLHNIKHSATVINIPVRVHATSEDSTTTNTCTTQRVEPTSEHSISRKINIVIPDMNGSKSNVSIECNDKSDIIVEPLEPVDSETDKSGLDSGPNVTNETQTEQFVDTVEDTIPVDEAEDNIQIDETQGKIQIDEAEDNIQIVEAEGNIQIDEAEGNIQINETEDNIPVDEAENNIQIDEAEDNIHVDKAEDNIPVDEAEDNINVDEEEDNIQTDEAEDNIPVYEAEDNTEIDEAEDNILVDEAENDILADEQENNIPEDEAEGNIQIDEAEDNIEIDEAENNISADEAENNIPVDEAEDNTMVDEAEDPTGIPVALLQSNGVTPCLTNDANICLTNGQHTGREMIVLKTVPSLTPVVLETEESAYLETDQSVLENGNLC